MPLVIDDIDRLRIRYSSLQFPASCYAGGWTIVVRVYRLSGFDYAMRLLRAWETSA